MAYEPFVATLGWRGAVMAILIATLLFALGVLVGLTS